VTIGVLAGHDDAGLVRLFAASLSWPIRAL
jgi:hypothetical protein